MPLSVSRLAPRLIALLLLLPFSLPAADEDLGVYTEHPRLFLTARRLKLLRREKERQSMRWEQFHGLIDSGAALPEKGFAYALYSQVTQQPKFCKDAVTWAESAQDLRQIAIVYDWCQPQAASLQPKIRQMLATPRTTDTVAVRTRLIAAIAGSEQPREFEPELKWVFETWWRAQVVPALKGGSKTMGRSDAYALAEIMHALNDNFRIDISEDIPKWFKDLPTLRLLQYYPASLPAQDTQFRVPAYAEDGEPNLTAATMARAADMALVAADPNSQSMQFLQGWVLHDQFLMRSGLGAPYEFLWANPYQPGLSYYYAPLVLHDRAGGQLFVRSSWDDDASWFGYTEGRGQAFSGGTRKDVKPTTSPLRFGPAVILAVPESLRFLSDLPEAPEDKPTITYVFGLKPGTRYLVEMDQREMTEETADAGGILALTLPAGQKVNVRLREGRAKQR